MVTLRSAAPPDAGDVARVHVRSWQAAYRGLLPADFLAGLQPTDWAAGYTFDAQDPVTTVAVDSRSGIVGFATMSITPIGRLMAMYVDPDLWGLVVSCSSREWIASEPLAAPSPNCG